MRSSQIIQFSNNAVAWKQIDEQRVKKNDKLQTRYDVTKSMLMIVNETDCFNVRWYIY